MTIYPAPQPPKTARKLLLHAADLVSGERARTYGDMLENHQNIADLWNGYLGDRLEGTLTPTDVALMQVLLKVARTKEGDLNEDDFTDIAGYAACAWEIASRIAGETTKRVDGGSGADGLFRDPAPTSGFGGARGTWRPVPPWK